MDTKQIRAAPLPRIRVLLRILARAALVGTPEALRSTRAICQFQSLRPSSLTAAPEALRTPCVWCRGLRRSVPLKPICLAQSDLGKRAPFRPLRVRPEEPIPKPKVPTRRELRRRR